MLDGRPQRGQLKPQSPVDDEGLPLTLAGPDPVEFEPVGRNRTISRPGLVFFMTPRIPAWNGLTFVPCMIVRPV